MHCPCPALGLCTCRSINGHVLDEATGHDAHAKVRVYDALQLSQDLSLQGLHMRLQAKGSTAHQVPDIKDVALEQARQLDLWVGIDMPKPSRWRCSSKGQPAL